MTMENQDLPDKPSGSTGFAPSTGSIFELVDATDDETYYVLGLYLDLETAISDAATGDTPPTDCEEFATLEIRERSLGFSGWGNNGKKVATVKWWQVLDEDKDDWMWKKEVISNVERSREATKQNKRKETNE